MLSCSTSYGYFSTLPATKMPAPKRAQCLTPNSMGALSRLNSALHSLPLVRDGCIGMKQLSLRHLSKAAKCIFYLLLILNARSLPLAWHIRIFRPVVLIRLRHRWMKLRTMLTSRGQREKEEDRWLDGLCPVGQDPFEMIVPYTSWASTFTVFPCSTR